MLRKTLPLVLGGIVLVLAGYIVGTRQGATPTVQAPTSSPPIDPRRAGRQETSPYEKEHVKPTLLKGAADEIQKCYKAWLPANPQFQAGRIGIEFQIQPTGGVANLRVLASDLPALDECVVKQVSPLKFAPPPAGQAHPVQHTFRFHRETMATPR